MGELNSDVCIRDLNMLWQNGIIPYEFNNKVINNLRQYVEITMKEISKVSSIRFVKRTDQLHFIEIVDKGEYWSSVGLYILPLFYLYLNINDNNYVSFALLPFI
ncbi:hypothetical protein C1646_680032 [Rhizophagus diaphanus]|nr:hypothetical protein C1646_680032 [Rhizophagus diaphanus] [Rhizophagus sp. MUCL 43196]